VSYVATHGRNPAGKPTPNAGKHSGSHSTTGHKVRRHRRHHHHARKHPKHARRA
jgi:hypothetical protein